ncbi:MAG: T9SS type A sorting domain-containing protein, partial [Bacteroidetes bacterium]|nr:T9SS type A sorting domain-containing protein [Bacteroidota bacterium]
KQYSRNLGTGEGIELLALGTKYIGELRLSVPAGTYNDSVVVEIESEVEDVSIHYTLDGSIPDQFSDQYAGEIIISNNSVLNAIAYKDGYVPSSVVNGSYIIRNTTGIPQYSSNGVKVYPTLVSDAVNLQIHNDISGDYNFRIYDYSGKLVKSLSLRKTTFKTSEHIDLSDLNPGTYVVLVQQGESRITSKIVKQ